MSFLHKNSQEHLFVGVGLRLWFSREVESSKVCCRSLRAKVK
jgi:hypothetical protein